MTNQGAEIQVQKVSVSFAIDSKRIDAVQDVSADIRSGEFVALLGPSGCGKSSLLGAIAGFTPIADGEILVASRRVQRPDSSRGIVFQQHNLFPWKTVQANVEFGPKMRRKPKTERRRIAAEILGRVQLSEFGRHYPDQLSGGMQQRVNLARVLVNRPEVLLMDEPFAALDAQTRLQMQEMLLELWQEFGMTVVFVTHDIDEAILLSDRILIMSQRPGRIKAEVPVFLDRPRRSEQLTSPEFISLKRKCMESIRIEPYPASISLRSANERHNEVSLAGVSINRGHV
jgi:NitT/TauT family transport system ATP-binding protein